MTRQRALSTARTEVNRVRRSAALETYREHDDIVEGWIWVASKSTRTCALCLAMDGTVMKLKEDFPQHVNCRCTLRAKLIGVEPRQRQTGSEYFNELSDDDKKKVLGQTGFDAYKRGEVELKDFVAFKYDKRFGKSVTRKPLGKIVADKGEIRGIDKSRNILGRR
ncbi:MAG: phage minor head protein [Pyrinomonadaceae bacterium]